MSRSPIHQPPSPLVVDELVRAGLTWSTAMAMESWKAREVLDLLRTAKPAVSFGATAPMRGTI